MNTASLIIFCIMVGLGAGLVYGIFGGGSGLIMMPGFYYVLHHFALAYNYKMQIAIATTAAVSALLGISATWVQWRNKYIDFFAFKKIAPGLLVGVLSAIVLLNIVPSTLLKRLFGVIVILVALWLGCYRQEQDQRVWSLSSFKNRILSTIIGILWFLLGIAVFTVPYLHKCGLDLRRAIGCATLTSSVFSLVAAILLMITGLFQVGLSWDYVGFVNLPLLAVSVVPSALAGYFGSKLSIKLPRSQLKYIYVALVGIVGFLMLW